MNKDVYYHVGLGKTGTTYLQDQFFHKMKGIHVVHRSKFREYGKLVKASDDEKFFCSREFDQQLEEECELLYPDFPNLKTIIVLRKPASWIASQYRRFAKNGMKQTFSEFFDIDNDKGRWKLHEVEFSRKIKYLEERFGNKPLVLFHDELKKDPYAFFDKIVNFMGASYNREDISLDVVHSSHKEKQLKAVRKLSFLFSENPKQYKNAFMRRFQWRMQQLKTHLIMFIAIFIPARFFSEDDLVPKEKLKLIDEKFADDWQWCLDYARDNNTV